LPRAAVGRMCGARLAVDPQWLTRAPPLTCKAGVDLGRSQLRQEVLHMQFTHASTRQAILQSLHWWRAPEPPPDAAANSATAPSKPTTCAALAAGTAPASAGSRLAAAVVSSALASSTLVCLVPGVHPDQPVHLLATPTDGEVGCPCCWRVEDLQKGVTAGEASGDAAAAAAEAKALNRARRYTGCRIWRRHA
jgi:hypothetical protein